MLKLLNHKNSLIACIQNKNKIFISKTLICNKKRNIILGIYYYPKYLLVRKLTNFLAGEDFKHVQSYKFSYFNSNLTLKVY